MCEYVFVLIGLCFFFGECVIVIRICGYDLGLICGFSYNVLGVDCGDV